MFAALKDLITAVAAVTLLAYLTGQDGWLWNQIKAIQREILIESRKDWSCPSIFAPSACKQFQNRD